MNFDAVVKSCEDEQLTLARISNDEENSIVKGLIANASIQDELVYLGMIDQLFSLVVCK